MLNSWPNGTDIPKYALKLLFITASCSVKKGGPNPVSNSALATLVEKAKELDIPKDIVERNIKRASEKGQEAFIEKFYEV